MIAFMNRYAAAWTTEVSLARAMEQVAIEIQNQLEGRHPDLLLVFCSHHYADAWQNLSAGLVSKTGAKVLLGCSGESIVATGREIENGPALSVWAASWDGVGMIPFQATFERTPDGIVTTGLPQGVNGLLLGNARCAIVLADPYSSLTDLITDHLAEDLPNLPVIGGMASGGGPGENRLFYAHQGIEPQVFEEGAIGVILSGNLMFTPVVSQGCKPVGTTYVVTKADRNFIVELGGEPPLARLEQLYADLSATDQRLIENGLHLGLAMTEYRDQFRRGDFLIANVIGADRNTGVLAIGGKARVGQTVQFHLRDHVTASEDLVEMLQSARSSHPAPQAALLFTCNGRGTRLFSAPHHDAQKLEEFFGPVPVAGFFAQGELGQVGTKNFLHGFTASIGLFG